MYDKTTPAVFVFSLWEKYRWGLTSLGQYIYEGGVMVLGKLPVSGRPTYLDYSIARAFCACSR